MIEEIQALQVMQVMQVMQILLVKSSLERMLSLFEHEKW